MTRKGYVVLAALVILIATSKIEASPIATLTLQSQPGDFIGQGENFDITYPINGGPLSATGLIFVRGLPAVLEFGMGSANGLTNTFAILFFGTNQLIPMQPGTYDDAVRPTFGFPGHPALDIEFQNRGCNTDTGSFVVTDATFFPDNTISSFSASFEQHCEGATPALFGTFTYNANATEVPEPAAYSLVGVGVVCLLFMRLQRRSVSRTLRVR
jgi:hypothetical protein